MNAATKKEAKAAKTAEAKEALDAPGTNGASGNGKHDEKVQVLDVTKGVPCPYQDGETVELPLDLLIPDPNQPRRDWIESADDEDKTELERLAMTVRTHGILEDITVRPNGDGKYKIAFGERRWRAGKIAGIQNAKCKVRTKLTDDDVFEMQIIENLHRKGLSAVDEAHAYKNLMERKGYSAKQLAAKLGISSASLTYKLGLLGLTPELQKAVHKGELRPTDARFVTQEVNRIEGPNKEEHKQEAMNRIAGRVKEHKKEGVKLTAKDVQVIAKQEVAAVEEKRVQPKPAKANKSSGKVQNAPVEPPKPQKPKNPSPAEKKQRTEFLGVVERTRKAFKKYEALAEDALKLSRFAQVLALSDDKADEVLYAAGKTLSKVYEQVVAQKRVLALTK